MDLNFINYKKLITVAFSINLTLALAAPALIEAQSQILARRNTQSNRLNDQRDVDQLASGRSFMDRILARPPVSIAANSSSVSSPGGQATNSTSNAESKKTGNEIDDEDNEDDGEDEDDEDEGEDDEEGEDEEVEVDSAAAATLEKGITRATRDDKIVTDMLGTKIRVGNDRTTVVGKNKARTLELLALKAIILGPLIGLTIKAALIRGIIYALGAYALHLFAPALLGSLGLGTGLVGFARQLQPNYQQMLAPQLHRLQATLPHSFTRLASQYQQVLAPIIESIRSIPEGHCRYRAVCETSYQLIRNARSMSNTLQRISATVYSNFGSDYSKAWLDGIVQSDCAAKYPQCNSSPFSMVAARLAQALGARGALPGAQAGAQYAGISSASALQQQQQQQQQVIAANVAAAGGAGATEATATAAS